MHDDEFTERAVREFMTRLTLAVMREEPFLAAVRGAGWLTLDGVVAALDESGYWEGGGWTNVDPLQAPPSTPAGKRKHAREMIEHLAPDRDDKPAGKDLEKALATMFKATDAGDIERHFKVFGELTKEDLEDTSAGHLASAHYNLVLGREAEEAVRALERGEGAPSAAEHYMRELTEATMLRAWPGLGPEERGWVVALGTKVRDAMEEMLNTAQREREAGRLPSVEQFEAFVADRTERIWDALADELSDRLGWTEAKAQRFLAQPALRTYSWEFSEALDNHESDSFGWTLDEHLAFVVDEREQGQEEGGEG